MSRTQTNGAQTAAPKMLKSYNPRTGEVVAEIPAVAPGEVRDVVAQARKVAPEWAAIDPRGRVGILSEVRHRIYDRLDDIVETVAAECGKPRAEALAHDVLPVVMMFAYLERITPKTFKPEKGSRLLGVLAGAYSQVEWRPFGVVGCITPWNYPITNCFLAVATPLFAGNAVVIKPSEVTPRCGELVRDLLEPLPAGVATLIQGGGDVGAALVDAPCDKISFVGSPATGRRICEAAAKHLTPVVMELGGKDAALVCSDADVDFTSSGLVWGSFFNAGQTCCSIERAYVVDSVADEFTSQLLEKLDQVKQGEEVGSLTFSRQLEVVERHVDDAVAKGAEVLAGGPGAGRQNENGSLWYAPTVLGNVTPDMDVIKEETFGPVLSITRVRDEEEAVRRANEDGVNLTASIWSKDRVKAERLGAKLKAGTVTVNFHAETVAAPWAPWGGVGESGFGRLNGRYGLREFAVPVNVARNALPALRRVWWYPYDEPSNETLRGIIDVIAAPTFATKAKGLGKLAANAGRALKNKL